MSQPATAEKLPGSTRYRDLSDYARPIAVWIARRLRDTRVRAPHVTLVFGIVGLVAAACYLAGTYAAALAGAAAMQLKNILDAVDGSLARLQNRSSRIGRFLDSITDAVVAAAIFAALGTVVARTRGPMSAIPLAGAALLLGLLQASVFNYYSVRYRARHGGDPTSRLEEHLGSDDQERYRGRPGSLRVLRALVVLYGIIYRWQDRLVAALDGWAVRPLIQADRQAEADRLRDDRRFLTAVSLLGPGIQILVLDLFTLAGYWALPEMLEAFLWTVLIGGSGYALGLLLVLRVRASRRRSRVERVP